MYSILIVAFLRYYQRVPFERVGTAILPTEWVDRLVYHPRLIRRCVGLELMTIDPPEIPSSRVNGGYRFEDA